MVQYHLHEYHGIIIYILWIMEHIMLSHITKHIAKNNILISEQHGFRNKLSTTTQLINTATDWANTQKTKVKHTLYFLILVKHSTQHHINFSYPNFTTMVLEITHLIG